MGNRYGLEIRAAAGPDAAGLAALLGEAAIAVGPADLAARLDALQRDGGTALVAVEWGPPSGLVAVSPVRTLDAPRPFGLITTLVVAAESRRRGIGRVLLKAAGRAARQAGCDRLLLSRGAGPGDAARLLCRSRLHRGWGDPGAAPAEAGIRRGLRPATS